MSVLTLLPKLKHKFNIGPHTSDSVFNELVNRDPQSKLIPVYVGRSFTTKYIMLDDPKNSKREEAFVSWLNALVALSRLPNPALAERDSLTVVLDYSKHLVSNAIRFRKWAIEQNDLHIKAFTRKCIVDSKHNETVAYLRDYEAQSDELLTLLSGLHNSLNNLLRSKNKDTTFRGLTYRKHLETDLGALHTFFPQMDR